MVIGHIPFRKRHPARREFEEGHSQRVEIRAMVDSTAHDLLRRHVLRAIMAPSDTP